MSAVSLSYLVLLAGMSPGIRGNKYQRPTWRNERFHPPVGSTAVMSRSVQFPIWCPGPIEPGPTFAPGIQPRQHNGEFTSRLPEGSGPHNEEFACRLSDLTTLVLQNLKRFGRLFDRGGGR